MTRGLLRRLAALMLAAGLCCALAGCGSDAPVEMPTDTPMPEPTSAPTAEPMGFVLPCYPSAGFHPITGANRTNLTLCGLLYEGLFELDQSFTPRELLCSGYTVSEDGLTWTFTLRSGVTFSDGTPLTAREAASSLNAARGSDLYSARLTGIKNVAAGEGTVAVVLNEPNGALPALLDIPIVKESGGDAPLGTGPYVLSGGEDELSLTARADWWQGRALPLEEIPLRAIRAAGDLIHAFDTQEVSLVATDLTGANTLGFSGSYETTDYPTSVMLYVGFNCAAGLCKDQTVRQALQRSMDRASVTTALLSRHARPAALPAAPESALYDSALAEGLDYDLQAAEELLTAAGWSRADQIYTKGHQSMKLTMIAATDNTDKLAVAEFLAESLTQAGFSVELQELPWEDYIAALEGGSFDLYLGEVRLTGDLDPSVLIAPDGALNYGGYADGALPELLGAFRSAQGDARPAAAQALCRHLAEQAPFAVLCFKSWSVLTRWDQISGLTPTQQNVFHGFADWEISQ